MVEVSIRARGMRALLAMLLLGAWLPLQAATPLGDVASPDGTLQVEMALDDDGRPTWRLLRQGREVVAPSPLGMVGEGVDLSRGLAFAGVDPVQPVADDYELLSGKRRHNQYRANRRVFHWKDAQGHTLAVAWQVSNDGAAFRYELARAVPGLETWKRDAASFRLPADAHAWLQPLAEPKTGFGRTNPSYEEYYLQDVRVGTPTPMGHGWAFPALFRAGGDWILLSEGSLRRGDAGSRLLDGATPGEYLIGFPDEREALPGGAALPWIDSFPWRSPWRIVAVGDLATVVDSTLGTDLADPPAVAATSVPGKASWSWPLLGDESTVFEVQKQFVDYAARMGWRYTLVDALWDTQIGEPKMRELIDHAHGKDVSVLVWYNSAGDWNEAPQTPRSKLLDHASRVREFKKLQAMGVAGLKIDFFGGDGSSMIAYYLDLLADAAPHGFQMNFHGSTLPRGWQRTWPHLQTMEAVRGLEFATFEQGNADQVPVHAATLPFTRNVFDPMDFTPLAMVKLNDRVQRRTRPAFELAQSVLFFSGIQHYAETAEGMAQVPGYVRDFLAGLPEVWDDSRFLDGYPGQYAVFARQGDGRWFVGGINAGPGPRKLILDADRLGGGVQRGLLVTDGGDAPGFAQRRVEFAPGKPLELELPAAGGFVLQLD
ncbi:Glycoside hydrolase 97 [Pseudoxanthomonas suwonensis 11-1]|uniref:Glycoside hydrolase 97 n=1 Tax=Pseudoxanthomonas suwonensis (strain 11-1) TaxID=743721 RepID=E6WRK8_PSEUU|nr:glycoside hydrolase family 97 protein [Pseudoxanthomonas suwonensis]ADV26739.1 Glycoside hydrolase 97 [Pseudoxanthomonas suwonensis 11-1]